MVAIRVWLLFAAAALSAVLLLPAVFYYQTEVYVPDFNYAAQLGAASDTAVRLWVRAEACKHIVVEYYSMPRRSKSASLKGPLLPPPPIKVVIKELEAHNHYIRTLVLPGLSPSTCYAYNVTASTCAGTKGPVPIKSGSFCSFPSAQAAPALPGRVEFSFGSCMTVSVFPFSALRVFDYIRQRLAPSFVLFLGDLVYTDINSAVPWYRIPFRTAYHQVWSDPSLDTLLTTTPSFYMFDDHEIENNFAGGPREGLVMEALSYYQKYLGARNPPPLHPNEFYYEFNYGRLAEFFVLDTRSLHQAGEAGGPRRLGQVQKDALVRWLTRTAPAPALFRFIVSPIPFTTAAEDGEGWREDTAERDEIFDIIDLHNLCGVVLLSGDSHYGAVYRYRGHITEFSASPFQALLFPAPPNGVSEGSDEEVVYRSTMSFHFGHVTIDAPAPGEETVTFDVYKYFLSEPARDYSITVRRADTCNTSGRRPAPNGTAGRPVATEL